MLSIISFIQQKNVSKKCKYGNGVAMSPKKFGDHQFAL